MFDKIPNEIICYIIKFLDPTDINSCLNSSKIFHILNFTEYSNFRMSLWEQKYFSLDYYISHDENELSTFTYLAKIIYNLYKINYICSSIRNNTWYELKDDEWIEIKDVNILKIKIFELLEKKFSNIYIEILKNLDFAKGTFAAKMIDKARKINSIILSLHKCSFRNEMFLECKNVFYQKQFQINGQISI